jgi:hypothetical protein
VRKITAGLFITLDGVVEAPEKWNPPYYDDELGQAVMPQLMDVRPASVRAALLRAVPGGIHRTGRATAREADDRHPEVVVSTTLDQPSWGHTTLISGNVVGELSRLRQQPGGNVQVAASGSLVRLLLQEGLLDELRLRLHPIVVGTGQHLFEGGASGCRSICSNAVRTATVIALRYALAA